MDGGDDWDDVPAPVSRSDRIHRITSPDQTLQRPPPHPNSSHMMSHSTSSLARTAQLQQLQLQQTMALMQQQQQQLGLHGLLDHHMPAPHPPPPNHIASLRRQAQFMALQAAAAQTGSLPRGTSGQQQMFSIPASPTSSRGMRYRSPAASLPPTNGPLRQAPSPNLSSARRMQQLQQQRSLELGLDPARLHMDSSLPRRNPRAAAYWGQHDQLMQQQQQMQKGPFDPFAAAAQAQQQAIYSADGSTSSYARVNHNNNSNIGNNGNRQSQSAASQTRTENPQTATTNQHTNPIYTIPERCRLWSRKVLRQDVFSFSNKARFCAANRSPSDHHVAVCEKNSRKTVPRGEGEGGAL
ncbi:hypothetical protein BV898_04918 [Hypsibius exemplaris]|uniref:Uncharacterized protein n=1 Tax=Hypsibius exemplaris TaxID=2072580 RepID=A0A1W0X0Y6_HYPEX|nr:hypothetical protein BV898_04918 [Hypsibius exemplaris]